MNNSICLNMIVKNESHVIKSTLENLYKYIKFSYYVISDTGSTDNTISIIKDFFDSNNIKGEIYNDEWKDFGYNRTLALNYAYKKTEYLFIFDADDNIHGSFNLPSNLDQDGYYLKFGNNTTYKRMLLINNNLSWKFKGVLHEYLECTEKNITLKSGDIKGEYYIDSGKTGSRSIDPLKYFKDAEVLSKAFYEAEKNNDDIKIRYAFYTAQSYRDSNQKEKAIEWYKKRALLNNWNQETYYSYYMIGNLYYELNQVPDAIYFWTLAYEEDNERYETLYQIITHLRKNNKYLLAYQYYKMIKNKNPDLKDKLFATYPIYSFLLDYELTLILYHNKKFNEALDPFLNIFLKKNNNSFDINLLLNIFDNFRFYINHLDININLIHNFYNYTHDLLKKIKFSPERINYLKNITQYITNKYDNNNIYLKSIMNNLKNNNNNPTIFLSMTTCKRYDLFVKTVNSLLVCFKDIKLIDYFLCVDDNSSNEDRQNMIRNYPFFQYYLKKENEKGHLSSMNIIWNKLNELKPKYWINIEDDWLFFKPDNYIIKSTKFLEKYKSLNISQILFNKNYAETLDDLDIIGGKNLDDDFILHIKDEPNLNGKNCAYWPHYSFRPSVCLVDTILKLGNFDSELTFFEKTYADKYFSNGFQSAFFNEITSIHTGKLTNDKNTDNKNAYQLNNIEQFNSNNNLIKKNDNNYAFIKNKDHYGNDLFYKPNLSINEMILLCNENDNIIAFNSLGYFKNEININTLIDLNFPHINNNDIGLFINIDRFNKINNLFSPVKNNAKLDITENVIEYLKEDSKLNTINENVIEDAKLNTSENVIEDSKLDTTENMIEDAKLNTTENVIEELVDNQLSSLINIPKFKFILFKNKTVDNNEIELFNSQDLVELIKYTINNNNCIGFSTDGSMKNNIHLNMFVNNDIDTYIDLDKYIKIHYTDFLFQIPFITIIDNYLFIKNKDYVGYDIDFKNNLSINEMIELANKNNNCKSFNTLGFFKDNINLNELITNHHINQNNNGIFIKINELNHNLIIKNINTSDHDFKNIDETSDSFVAYHSSGYYKKDLDLHNPVFSNSIYNNYLSIDISKLYLNKLNIKKNNNKIRIKLICDYCNSLELCKELNKISMGSLQWNNLEFTYLDDFIDYYVIIDGLFEDTYFIPSKTIFFITKDLLNPIIIKYNFLHIENIYRYSWNFDKTYIELNNYIPTNKINKFNLIISEDLKDLDLDINNLDKNVFDIDINNIFDYKYVIIIEKDINDRVLFDKIFDSILNNSLVFYYGNNYIFNYLDNDSIIMLDNYNTDYLNNIMKVSSSDELFNSNFEFIKEAKHKILNEYNIFSKIEKIISS